MKYVLKTFVAAAMLFMSAALFSQASIDRINSIDKKTTAVYGDAVALFKAETSKNVYLDYKDDAPLTRGMVALMAAKYLDLKGSFMYNIFGTERYAVKACVAENIMDANSSSSDLMSGADLLEVLGRIALVKREAE